MNKVLMIDTSILCVWLKVPNMDTCGSDANRWDFDHVNSKIETEIQQGTRMILPLATIIETGNHIAQANGDRYKAAQ
ncbi:MAG: hypothetical protein RIS47_540, partial [Bacteroidota bacterium]